MSEQPTTEREDELLSFLDRWATTLDELADIFRATAGERSQVRSQVYADVAVVLRAKVKYYRARAAGEARGGNDTR